MNAGDLRCLIDIYEPKSGTNALGEDTLDELSEVKNGVPAQIIPMTGTNRDMMGGLDTTEITHKIRIRTGVVDIQPNYVIEYAGQRYDVRWWQPVYKNERFMEIMTVMEVAI